MRRATPCPTRGEGSSPVLWWQRALAPIWGRTGRSPIFRAVGEPYGSERGGNSLPTKLKSESTASSFAVSHAAPCTHLPAGEAYSLHDFHGPFHVSRTNHTQHYPNHAGSYTNGAEELFSRMRRAEIGYHHQVARVYLFPHAGNGLAEGSPPGGPRAAGPDSGGSTMASRPSLDWWGFQRQSGMQVFPMLSLRKIMSQAQEVKNSAEERRNPYYSCDP